MISFFFEEKSDILSEQLSYPYLNDVFPSRGHIHMTDVYVDIEILRVL